MGTRAPSVQNRDEITLTVSDSGIVIPPEDLPHLFERFHRGRNVSEFTGNGLGLAIVKAIVEAHGGIVRANSGGPGGGGEVIVGLGDEKVAYWLFFLGKMFPRRQHLGENSGILYDSSDR